MYCAEILAIKLRKDDRIEGLPINDILYLLGQFADDMDAYLRGTAQSIDAFFDCIEWYHHISGFTVNYDKTTVYRIGSLRDSNAIFYTQRHLTWTNGPVNILGVWIARSDESIQMNYNPLLEKAKTILSSWSKRSLSLYGKVNIINTLIASLFVYRMLVLPVIGKDMIKRLEDMITKFLWSNGTSKISLKILKCSKESGGLNLVDFYKKDLALKVSWINIIKEDIYLANLAYRIIAPELKELIWCCNLSEKQIPKLFRMNFWTDVLYAWSKLNFKGVDMVENPGDQILWLNSNILIDNKPVKWSKCIARNLFYVKQLYPQGQVISAILASQLFSLSWMELHSLISVIPKWWRVKLTNSLTNGESISERTVDRMPKEKPSRWAYKQLTHMPELLESKALKWQCQLDMPVTTEQYIISLKSIDSVTIIPKLQSFQYKLVQRALVTNIQLAKWRIKDSALCSFCGEQEETIEHMFIYCTHVKELWLRIEPWMSGRFGENPAINFEVATVLFNNLVPDWGHAKNFICLLVKYYVYRQRCLKEAISFSGLQQYITRIEQYEKFYATVNNKLHKHYKKWCIDSEQGTPIEQFVVQYINSIN